MSSVRYDFVSLTLFELKLQIRLTRAYITVQAYRELQNGTLGPNREKFTEANATLGT